MLCLVYGTDFRVALTCCAWYNGTYMKVALRVVPVIMEQTLGWHSRVVPGIMEQI